MEIVTESANELVEALDYFEENFYEGLDYEVKFERGDNIPSMLVLLSEEAKESWKKISSKACLE